MKTKLLLLAFMMLTVSTLWSQDTTNNNNWNLEFENWNLEFKNWDFPRDTTDTRPVTFPFWMVQAIALDLEEKNRLEQEVQLLVLEKETLEDLVEGLEKKDQSRRLQLELLEKNQNLLEVQFQAEKSINMGEDWVIKALQLLGALGTGFILGNL